MSQQPPSETVTGFVLEIIWLQNRNQSKKAKEDSSRLQRNITELAARGAASVWTASLLCPQSTCTALIVVHQAAVSVSRLMTFLLSSAK